MLLTDPNIAKYFPQLLATFAANINSISDGIHYAWASPVLPLLAKADTPVIITPTDGEWLEMIYMIGSLAGLPLTMYSVDRFGRKNSILLAGINSLLAWILIAVATNVEMLFVARFLAGLAGDVAFVSVPMYIGEIADQKIRGFLAAVINIMMLVGVIVCYSVAPFVSIIASSSVGAGFVVIQLATLPFMPESPYYYLLKGKGEQAEKALRWLRNSDDVAKEFEDIKAAVARQSSERGKLKDIVVVKSNRKALIIMAFMNAGLHLSGISVMVMNLHTILVDAEGMIDENISAIIFSVIMLFATIASASIVDKFGRKSLVVASSVLSSITLGALAIYLTFKHSGFDVMSYNWVPVLAVFVYAAAFRIGLGCVPIVLTGELFPTSVKAFGMTLSDGMFVIFGFLALYLYAYLEVTFGIYIAFYIFSASCLLTAACTIFFVPETKGKTLDEIQFILKGTSDCEVRNGVVY